MPFQSFLPQRMDRPPHVQALDRPQPHRPQRETRFRHTHLATRNPRARLLVPTVLRRCAPALRRQQCPRIHERHPWRLQKRDEAFDAELALAIALWAPCSLSLISQYRNAILHASPYRRLADTIPHLNRIGTMTSAAHLTFGPRPRLASEPIVGCISCARFLVFPVFIMAATAAFGRAETESKCRSINTRPRPSISKMN